MEPRALAFNRSTLGTVSPRKSTGSVRPEAFHRQFVACCGILFPMRSRASRITAALILLICIVCPLVETFDQWDDSIQTGNDTEYTLIVLALCVGVAYSFARFICKRPSLRFVTRSIFDPSFNKCLRPSPFSSAPLLLDVMSTPTLALRI
jgi:hypothetical protein